LYYLFSVFDFLLLGKKSKKNFETKQKQRPLSQFLKTTVSVLMFLTKTKMVLSDLDLLIDIKTQRFNIEVFILKGITNYFLYDPRKD
jgi:hypothetical protein